MDNTRESAADAESRLVPIAATNAEYTPRNSNISKPGVHDHVHLDGARHCRRIGRGAGKMPSNPATIKATCALGLIKDGDSW